MPALPSHFPVSLRSWSSADSDPNRTLPSLIQHINSTQGGFLDLDEDGLREEIAKEEAGDGAGEEEVASLEEEEDKPDRMKELMSAREEMLAQIEQAHQQAMFALDFVSLLMSKDQPNHASLSISPFLREHVGMGTMGADKVQSSKITEAQKDDNKRIAKGWKIQNLNKTADSILASATRLEKEIELETKYWEQVLAISEKGWAICRLPNEKHTLGVRFGFSEAGPMFKNRSLAALRRETDGSISLDQGIASSKPQCVRVRIYSNGEQTGCSIIPPNIADDAPIEARIQRARNVIFEAELWHELNRESRTLRSLEVRCKGDTIICPISSTKHVVLDLVFLDNYISTQPMSDDKQAEGISLALHLLLIYAHRQNFYQRTKPPGPLTSFKRSNQPYALLRSLIARANHQSTLSRTYALFESIRLILTAVSHSPSPVCIVTEPPTDPNANISRTETTIQVLFEHLQVQVSLNLAASCTLKMRIRTLLYPLAMSSFNLILDPMDCALQESCRAPGAVDQWHKANDYVHFAVACALASSFVSPATESDDTGTEDEATPTLRWETTTRPHTIRLIPTHQEKQQQCKGKQASFFLTPAPSVGSKTRQIGMRLRVNWECISDASYPSLMALSSVGSDAALYQKAGQGEGFYEWVISEPDGHIAGRGVSGKEIVWGPDTPIKSLKEIMALAGSTQRI